MIIPEVKSSTLTNSVALKSVEFSITNNEEEIKKLMGILTYDLYKNKPGAVIRELSTNCIDAHKLVANELKSDQIGAKTPFAIILPSDYNNNFLTIRDFGPGLTEEEMFTIYPTYGSSTKENTNDYTGCLGLGSKSPLAISPDFLVTSYNDDKVAVYKTQMLDGKTNLDLRWKDSVLNAEVVDDMVVDNEAINKLIFKNDYEQYFWYKNHIQMNITYNNFLRLAINLKNFYNIGSTLAYIFILRTENSANHYKLVFDINKLNEDDLDQNKTFNYYITNQNDNKIFSGTESNILDSDDLSDAEQKNYDRNFSFFSINLLDILPDLANNDLTGYIFEELLVHKESEFRILNDEELKALTTGEHNDYNRKLKEYTVKEDARIKDALLYSSSFNSGLKIEVPINDQYKSQLLNEIEKQLLFFETKPYVINYTNFGPEVHELVAYQEVLEKYFLEYVPNFYISDKKVATGTYWGVDKKHSDFISAYTSVTNRGETFLLVQGNVTYPIDLQAMVDTLKSASRDPRFEIEREYLPIVEALRTGYFDGKTEVRDFRSFFCGVMFFDIGEINFHPSRESLNYDITTSLKIFDKIIQVLKLVESKMLETTTTCIDDIHAAGVRYSISNNTDLVFENHNFFGPARSKVIDTIFPKILQQLTPEKTILEKLKELYKPGGILKELTTTKREAGSEYPEVGKIVSNRNGNYNVASGYSFERSLLTTPLSTVLVFVDSMKGRKNFMEHYADVMNYYISKAKAEDQEAVDDFFEKNPDENDARLIRKRCKIQEAGIRLIDSKVQDLPKLSATSTTGYGYFSPVFINREHLKDENISPEDFMKALGMVTYNDIYPRAFNLKDEMANLIKIGRASLPEKTRSSTAGIQKVIGTIKLKRNEPHSVNFSVSDLYYKKKLRDEQLVELFDKILAVDYDQELSPINKTILIIPITKRGDVTKSEHPFFTAFNTSNASSHSEEIYGLMQVSKFEAFTNGPDGVDTDSYVIRINSNMFEQVRDELIALTNNAKYLNAGIKILDIYAAGTIDAFFDHIVKTYNKKVIDITPIGEIGIDPRFTYNGIKTHLNKVFTDIKEYEEFKQNPYPKIIKEFYFSWYALHKTVLNRNYQALDSYKVFILKIFLYKASDIALPPELLKDLTFDIYTRAIVGPRTNRDLILNHVIKKYNEIKPTFIQLDNNNIFELIQYNYNRSDIDKNDIKYPLLNNVLNIIANKKILDAKCDRTDYDKLVNRFEKINPNIYRNTENVLTNYLRLYTRDIHNLKNSIIFSNFGETGVLLDNGEIQYKVLATTTITSLSNQETQNKKLKKFIFGKEYKKQKQLAIKAIADMYQKQADEEAALEAAVEALVVEVEVETETTEVENLKIGA